MRDRLERHHPPHHERLRRLRMMAPLRHLLQTSLLPMRRQLSTLVLHPTKKPPRHCLELQLRGARTLV